MHSKGKGNSNRGAEKNEVFTLRSVAKEHIEQVRKFLPSGLRWCDPFAGDGAYLDACETFGIECDGYDINPKRSDIIKQDIYQTQTFDYDVAISNPPFSRNTGTQVFKELDRLQTKYVVFFWPLSAYKESTIRQIPRNYHLFWSKEYRAERGTKWFSTPNKTDNMNMCLQIWERREELRYEAPKPPKILQQYLWDRKGKVGTPLPKDLIKYTMLGYASTIGQFVPVKPGETVKRNTYWYLMPDTPIHIINLLKQYNPYPDAGYCLSDNCQSISLEAVNGYLACKLDLMVI
jgi:hypothetical protein